MSFYTDFIQVPSQGPAGLKGERGDPGPTNTNDGSQGNPGPVGITGVQGLPGVSGGEIYAVPLGTFVPWAPTLKHIITTDEGTLNSYYVFWNFYGGNGAIQSGSTSGYGSNMPISDNGAPLEYWIENTGFAPGSEPTGFYKNFWVFVKNVSGEDHVWTALGGAAPTPVFTLGTWIQLNGIYDGWERTSSKLTITRADTNTGTSEGEIDFWVVQSGDEPTGDPSLGGESPSATYLGRVKSTVIVP